MRRGKPFDAMFKLEAERAPEQVLRLFGLRYRREQIEILPTEITVHRKLDFAARVVLKAVLKDEERIVHVECERSPEPDLLSRVFVYNAMVHAKTKLPVQSFILVCADNRPTIPERAVFGSATIHAPVVHLVDHPHLRHVPELAGLGVIATPPAERDEAIRAVSQDMEEEQLVALHELALALGASEGTLSEVEALMTTFERRAILRGREEGREEGRIEAMRMLLGDRFAAIEPIEAVMLVKRDLDGVLIRYAFEHRRGDLGKFARKLLSQHGTTLILSTP